MNDLVIPLGSTLHLSCSPQRCSPPAWTSSDPAVASVRAWPRAWTIAVTAHALGHCTLTAQVGELMQVVAVEVVGPVLGVGRLRLVGRDIPAVTEEDKGRPCRPR